MGVQRLKRTRYRPSFGFERWLHNVAVQRLTYISTVVVDACSINLENMGSCIWLILLTWLYRGMRTVLRSIYLRNKVREYGPLRPAAS